MMDALNYIIVFCGVLAVAAVVILLRALFFLIR
jgi:hypothetical protein